MYIFSLGAIFNEDPPMSLSSCLRLIGLRLSDGKKFVSHFCLFRTTSPFRFCSMLLWWSGWRLSVQLTLVYYTPHGSDHFVGIFFVMTGDCDA